ncbi:hypothetical protein F4604DRAFT_1673775 [Suillus subluteus]|nr:hypothetical protein F4604DRAFT_1673775 [Suillus subluteus]
MPDAESEIGQDQFILSMCFEEETEGSGLRKKRGAHSASEGVDVSEQPFPKRRHPLAGKDQRYSATFTSTTNVPMSQSSLLDPVLVQDPVSDKKWSGLPCTTLAQPPFKCPHTTSAQTNPPLSPTSAGCKWSLQDWSCTYDTPYLWRSLWGANSAMQEHLGAACKNLLSSITNLFSQQLFDNSRDSFHNLLNAHDLVVFPCFGTCMTSTSAILEYNQPMESHVQIALTVAPPVLFFELGPAGRPAVVPSNTLELPSQCGQA